MRDDILFGDVPVSTALAALSAGCPALKEVIAKAGILPRIAACQEAGSAYSFPAWFMGTGAYTRPLLSST